MIALAASTRFAPIVPLAGQVAFSWPALQLTTRPADPPSGDDEVRPKWGVLYRRRVASAEPRNAPSVAPATPGTAAAATPTAAGPRDDELIEAIRGGDAGALAVLYDRHGRQCFAVAYRVLDDGGAAEDAVQEAFLAVWRQAGSYRPERGAVRTWLLAIARNAAVDRRRGRHARPLGDVPLDGVEARLATEEDDTFAIVASGLLREQVRAALAALPAGQRQAIELAFFHGLTHQEIAERTGLPLGTIKGRLRLGLHKLRVVLAPATGGDRMGVSA